MYIAIEGVIGVGKTTLTRMLCERLQAQQLLEIFEENPFLSDFYDDRARYAFQTQIYFLLSRYHQQAKQVPGLLETGDLIADYTFAKDRLFALANLIGDELDTYNLLHDTLAVRIPKPDLVIYLRAETDVLMARIAMRDRAYERSMDPAYIDALRSAYDQVLLEQDDPKVLVIETNTVDFVKHPADFEHILAQVRAAVRGVYQPMLPLPDLDD